MNTTQCFGPQIFSSAIIAFTVDEGLGGKGGREREGEVERERERGGGRNVLVVLCSTCKCPCLKEDFHIKKCVHIYMYRGWSSQQKVVNKICDYR